jgi:hypothetical protein
MNSSTDIMRYLAINYFNNECFVTKEKFTPTGFVIHHVEELDEGEVLRKQFPNGENGRAKYLKKLSLLIQENYEECNGDLNKMRYVLILNQIHTKLDHIRNGVTRGKLRDLENRKRFCDLTMRTIHKTKKEKRK